MYFALYIMSAAISMRLMRYMAVKNLRSWSLLVFTLVPGGSILCVAYGVTCKHATVHCQRQAWKRYHP